MINAQCLKHNTEEVRSEILFAIKERINEITSGRIYMPVFFKKMIIKDPNYKGYGIVNYFLLHSIFYCINNRLCGDLLYMGNSQNINEFMFGKIIDNLDTDELTNILNVLYTEKWSIMDSEDFELTIKNSKESIFSRKFRKFKKRKVS